MGGADLPLVSVDDVEMSSRHLEDWFADSTYKLMEGGAVFEVVRDLEETCLRQAELLRRESACVTRPARHSRLIEVAAELDAEAATWSLINHLYCTGDSIAGLGGTILPSVGNVKTSRQTAADIISQDGELQRCARAVAWLEAQMQKRMATRQPPLFVDGEGLWLEMRKCVGHAGRLVSELDPDAPTRTARNLTSDTRSVEERLVGRLWQLARAGQLPDALRLCDLVGQHWRDASLSCGAGPFGPLPVGSAAADQDDNLEPDWQEEDLSSEVEGGSGMARALWRWCCLQVAEQSSGLASGVGVEVALYGLLAGRASALPSQCRQWEDALWAHCRCWLDNAVDARLPHTWQDEDEVSADLVGHLLQRCGGGEARPVAEAAAALAEGVAVGRGDWPLRRSSLGPGGRPVLQGFEPILASLRSEGADSDVTPAVRLHHELQAALLAEQPALLLQHLHDAASSASGTAAPPDADRQVVSASLAHQEELSTTLPAVRCGAHVALLLRALHVARDPQLQPSEQQEWLHGLTNSLVALYCRSLVDAGLYQLVPRYLVHLTRTWREHVADALLQALTTASAAHDSPHLLIDDAYCHQVYLFMEQWVAFEFEKQEALQQQQQQQQQQLDSGEEGIEMDTGPTGLYLSLRDDEVLHLVDSVARKAQRNPACGPAMRVALCRWYFYAFLPPPPGTAAAVAAAESRGPSSSSTWRVVYPSALEHLCLLATDLMAGNTGAALALERLMRDVLPPGFLEFAEFTAQGQLNSLMAEERDEGLSDEELTSMRAVVRAAQIHEWQRVQLSARFLTLCSRYAALESAYRSWTDGMNALSARSGSEGGADAQVLAARGADLADEVLQLVRTGWLGPEAVQLPPLARSDAGVQGGHRVEARLLCSCWPSAAATAHFTPMDQLDAYPQMEAAAAVTLRQEVEDAVSACSNAYRGVELAATLTHEQACPLMLTLHASPQEADEADPSKVFWGAVHLAGDLLAGVVLGAPRLTLVGLEAQLNFALALSHRIALARLVLMCAEVQQRLVLELDQPMLVGTELVSALALPAGRKLLASLSQVDVRQTLQHLAAAMEADMDRQLSNLYRRQELENRQDDEAPGQRLA